MTVGFLLAGPASGAISDRFGARAFATGGLLLTAATFVGLIALPADFNYVLFALLLAFNGIGMGLMAAPNTAAIMNAVPGSQRGAASGVRATGMNAGMVLSMGGFFTLMAVGLASRLPAPRTRPRSDCCSPRSWATTRSRRSCPTPARPRTPAASTASSSSRS
jgi:MFS family permease